MSWELRLKAIRIPTPETNVGDPVPYPRWWVFDLVTGERDGWITNEPSGAFVCFTNIGIRFSVRNSLNKALGDFA
jgi:hypothetical protein